MATQQLNPSSTPLAISPAFIAQQTETIVMTERLLSFSDDSFRVQTTDGRDVLQIKADQWSPLHHNKNVHDMAGNLLYTIKKVPFKLPVRFECVDPSGRRVLEVKGKFGLFGKTNIATFTNALAPNNSETLVMHGHVFHKQTEIKNEKTDELVALISWEGLNARNLIMGRQTYVVTIAPGVDIAMVAMMCVCMDERNDERRDNTNYG